MSLPTLPKKNMPVLLGVPSDTWYERSDALDVFWELVTISSTATSKKMSPKTQTRSMGEFISIRAQSELGLRTCGATQVVLPHA